jgi:hypothetical protein
METPVRAGAATLLLVALSGCTPLEVLDLTGVAANLPFEIAAPRLDPSPHAAALVRSGDTVAFRSSIPSDPRACERAQEDVAACADDDGDDLVDRWEDLLLDRLRPLVRFHRDEPLFRDQDRKPKAADVVAVGRVTPARDQAGHVRAFVLLVYHRDYGRCSVAGHLGDVERVVIDLEKTDEQLAVVGVYTAAHEYTPLDGSRAYEREQLPQLEFVEDRVTGEPRLVVYASAGKHATYVTRAACGAHGAVPCQKEACPDDVRIDRSLLFPIFNAGEPGRPRRAAPEPRLAAFDPWSPTAFCGFLPAWAMDNTRCAPAVPEKLRRDPFAGHAER